MCAGQGGLQTNGLQRVCVCCGCWGEVILNHFVGLMSNEWVRIQGFSMKTHVNNSDGNKKLCRIIWNCWNWWDFVIPKIYMYTWKKVQLCDPYIRVFIHVYMFTNCRKGRILYPGIKEQILYPYFNYFFSLFICCRSVWIQGFFYVWGKWRVICGCQVPFSILLVLRIKLLSSDLAENDFNPWAGYFFSYLRFEFQISTPQKGIMSFQSYLNATERKCLDSKALGRVIRNWI